MPTYTFLSDRGTEFISQVSRAVYETLGAVKKFTSSYHPQTNEMVERLNHTLCQMLSYLIADDQKNWDVKMLCNTIKYTSWDEVKVKTWEHETDLEQYGNLVSRYWAGDPIQVGGENAKYRRYRVQLAKRTLASASGERYVATGYEVCCDTRGRPGIY